ncbi:MAG: hypothetical protein QOJ86_4761 [Bradyrhizobium sp.]|jgi:hypothetical protein|nr:hypothetical protein [Bradyrhizobium sp.]
MEKNVWYEEVMGSDLEQGDILTDCPTYHPIYPGSSATNTVSVLRNDFDLVVLSQSCDLVTGREKLANVVLCPFFSKQAIEADSVHPLSRKGAIANAAKNKEPAFFVLDAYQGDGVALQLCVVHFRQVLTIPLPFLRSLVSERGTRLRLRSPYREALATRFANFFSRVALPREAQV